MLAPILGVVAALAILGVILWFARKGGSDAAQKGAATDALKDIREAVRPSSADELDSVRKQYRRD